MIREVMELIPHLRHFAVCTGETPALEDVEVVRLEPGEPGDLWLQLRNRFRATRIGMAPVLLGDNRHKNLRRAAFFFAPSKLLAYNSRGERHHLQLRNWIASLLFLNGVPLDRIWLRPGWLVPWKRDRSEAPAGARIVTIRPKSQLRPAVAILSPYLPWPLAHGGAVRIFNLLREASREFDIHLLAFVESEGEPAPGPLRDFCAEIVTVSKPRYREPRWSSIRPPGVREYASPEMRRQLDRVRRDAGACIVQVEYTQLADYAGDILVEHDVTFDLYDQVRRRQATPGAWWDWWRWRRFEAKAVRRYPRVVVMSHKDGRMLGVPQSRVIANGVDLERYRPALETEGRRLLFIGSFRHFPNVVAYRWFIERVYPAVRSLEPAVELTVVSGPDPQLHWAAHAGTAAPPVPPNVRMLEFIPDVRPLYDEANLVIVPTLESAGTNIKVLEAMAMERAVVSTPSGVAGLGLEHQRQVWLAETPEDFAAGIHKLLTDSRLRTGIARRAKAVARERFDWRTLGEEQRALFRELAGPGTLVRDARPRDLEGIARIAAAAPQASRWPPESYLDGRCTVAQRGGEILGFLAWREVAEDEHEILNLATAPGHRRQGVARLLLESALSEFTGRCFLEVRQSNSAARALYRQLGFVEAGRRPEYYKDPTEPAIVMALQSC
jgi:ribosomal protein S18 acetylase RimI-like enzyme